MTAFLIRRIGQAVAVVAGVMVLTFVLIHLEPGSAARAALGPHVTASRIAIFNSTYGLNEPLYRQFGTYLAQVARGNLGTSYALQEPVSALIAQRLPRDLLLLGVSTALALLIALPLGLYQALRRNRPGDYVFTGIAFTLYSMPAVLAAPALITVFCSAACGWCPPEAPQGDPTVTGLRRSGGPDAAGGHPDPDHGGPVQPVHALLGHRHPDPGLHPGGPGQGVSEPG